MTNSNRGRTPFAPTDKDRATVKSMSAFGVPTDDIAKVLSISPKTLRKYFWQELELGYIEANAKVAQSLFRKATGDTNQSVQAAIFWLKARAGWRDKSPDEIVGKKEQADITARTAERGTDWERLLAH